MVSSEGGADFGERLLQATITSSPRQIDTRSTTKNENCFIEDRAGWHGKKARILLKSSALLFPLFFVVIVVVFSVMVFAVVVITSVLRSRLSAQFAALRRRSRGNILDAGKLIEDF